MPKSLPVRPARENSVAPLLGAALALLAFYLVGAVFFDGFTLDLGSFNVPPPRYVAFVAFWMLFGGLSAMLLALAISRRLGSPVESARLFAEWAAVSERRFLIWTCSAAFALPLLLRLGVMHGAPLADDEGAYRFAAELLASGRLWVASPPLKLFFDQNFMINDGRLYPVYFLGWPALLAMGVWIRAPGIVNPFLSALTVPPLLGVLRHFAGPQWARAGVLLFLSAPFIQIAAATQLSHTACLMALTWCLFMYLRTRRDDASARDHAGFAFGFALAFCIRPQSAVAIGLPLIVSWGLALRRLEAGRRLRAVLAFLLPASTLAALFLGSLWAQNGSPWRVGYARYAQYIVANDLRFTTFDLNDLTSVAGFDFSQIGSAIARTAVGMFRLNADLFGWPSSFALLVLALQALSSRARILWAMAGSYLLLMLFQRDWGIDTFGPVHAFELALPIVVLTIVGARNLGERLTWTQREGVDSPRWEWSVFSPSLLGALIATAWMGFVPVRLEAVRQIADHINVALRAPQRSGLHRAVIFAPWPIAPPCNGVPRHFVFFRPVNDPDLRNDILWVNHVDIEGDRRLVESLPGRIGYVLRWTPECDVELLPLATLAVGDVPPALMARHRRGP
jgi:hypothetical protein